MNIPTLTRILLLLLSASLLHAQQISPYLLGTNVWYNPNQAVWDVHATAGHKIIRIGGHAYDDNMPSIAQLETWVNLIKSIGAEPLIQVSQYQDANAAAAVVRHFNVETNNPVKFWGIGNEPWLQRDRPDMGTIPGIVSGYVKTHAVAMKDVDPTIKIYVANMCYFEESVYQQLFNSTGVNSVGGMAPGKNYYYVDGASWHRYNDGDAIDGANDIIGSMEATRNLIDDANALHNRTGEDALGWGIGEFNANAGGGAPCSFGTGQMVGAVYGAAMKYGATFATMWSMLESGGSCNATDFSLIGNDLQPRATFRHLQLIAQNMSGEYADGTTNMGQDIYAFGSIETDQITVMLINRGGANRNFSLRLDQQAIAGDGVNINAGVNAQTQVAMTGNSTQLLIFNSIGELASRYTYTDAMFADQQTPQFEEFDVTIVPQSIPGTIEAESYFTQFGFQTEITGDDLGGGENIGWTDAGDYANYALDVPETGEYEVAYRVASIYGTGEFALVDSIDQVLSQMVVPLTGDWQTYATIRDTIHLDAGVQNLTLEAITDSWNLNWMQFTRVEDEGPTFSSNNPDYGPFQLDFKQSGDQLVLAIDMNLNTQAQLKIFSTSGKLMDSIPLTQSGSLILNVNVNYSPGIYFLHLESKGYSSFFPVMIR